MATDDRSPDDSIVSRRRVLAGAGTLLATGGGVLAVTTDRAHADVTMGELTIDGDTATVDSAPSSITIAATGEWEVAAADALDQVKQTLQVHVGGEGQQRDDLAEDAAFGPTSGTFDLSADLYSHDDVSQGDLTPANGETAETTLLVRVIISAVRNGSIITEAHVDDTAVVSITRDGLQVSVGGTGSVAVTA